MTTTTRFSAIEAPCGRIVSGEVFQDGDEQAMVTREMDYDCGCQTIRHEYHDGSLAQKVVHHDGRVLVDELLWAE
jgi:membrane-bound inhibitor of C-type lysozyme